MRNLGDKDTKKSYPNLQASTAIDRIENITKQRKFKPKYLAKIKHAVNSKEILYSNAHNTRYLEQNQTTTQTQQHTQTIDVK